MEPRPLNPKQLQFVANYIRQGSVPKAALEAGYSESKSVLHNLRRLLEDPRVAPLLVAAKQKVLVDEATNEAKFTYEMAMAEAEEAMRFAKEMENAGAFVKAVEHRAKLSGLLVDKIDLSQNVNFRIVIGGIDDQPKLVQEATHRVIAEKITGKAP